MGGAARHQVVELVLLRLTQSVELLDAIVRLVEVTCQVQDARLLLAVLALSLVALQSQPAREEDSLIAIQTM